MLIKIVFVSLFVAGCAYQPVVKACAVPPTIRSGYLPAYPPLRDVILQSSKTVFR
jgi:hypothetical protein